MSETPDWIAEMQEEHDRTPEWAQGRGLVEILGNLAYDLGVEAAKLTMMQQRVSELIVLVQEKKDVDSK